MAQSQYLPSSSSGRAGTLITVGKRFHLCLESCHGATISSSLHSQLIFGSEDATYVGSTLSAPLHLACHHFCNLWHLLPQILRRALRCPAKIAPPPVASASHIGEEQVRSSLATEVLDSLLRRQFRRLRIDSQTLSGKGGPDHLAQLVSCVLAVFCQVVSIAAVTKFGVASKGSAEEPVGEVRICDTCEIGSSVGDHDNNPGKTRGGTHCLRHGWLPMRFFQLP